MEYAVVFVDQTGIREIGGFKDDVVLVVTHDTGTTPTWATGPRDEEYDIDGFTLVSDEFASGVQMWDTGRLPLRPTDSNVIYFALSRPRVGELAQTIHEFIRFEEFLQ